MMWRSPWTLSLLLLVALISTVCLIAMEPCQVMAMSLKRRFAQHRQRPLNGYRSMYRTAPICPIKHKFGSYSEYNLMGYQMLKEGKGLNAQRCFKLALDLYLNRVSYIGADKEDLPKGYLYVRGRETYRQLVQQHAPDMYFPNLEEEDIDLYKKALKDAEKDPLTPGWYSSQAPSALPVAGKKFSSLDEAKSYYGDAKRQRENKIDHSKPKPWRRKADGDWWRSEHAQTIRIAASYNHQWSSQAKSMGRP